MPAITPHARVRSVIVLRLLADPVIHSPGSCGRGDGVPGDVLTVRTVGGMRRGLAIGGLRLSPVESVAVGSGVLHQVRHGHP